MKTQNVRINFTYSRPRH